MLTAVSGALINELHGGWGWWIATGGVVLVAAGLTCWLALRSDEGPSREAHPTVIVASHVDENPGRNYDSTLRYEDRTDGNRIHIEPREPYLDLVRSGGELTPREFWHSPWEYRFCWPTLDVKVVNNTEYTVVFHRAVFEVASSRPDLRAIPLLRGIAYGPYLPLINAGWGPMTNCVLRFQIFAEDDTDAGHAVTPELEWRFDGPDDAHERDALREFFATAGVDFAALERLAWSGTDGSFYYLPESSGLGELVPAGDRYFAGRRAVPADEYEKLRRQALGPFTRDIAVLRGTLSYTHVDRDGAPAEAVNPITSYVSFAEPGVGAPLPPSYTYQVKLRSEGVGYRIEVPVSQAIPPGDTDRFAFTIAADKSSFHDLTLHLRYNDDCSVACAPVSLELFASRFDVDRSR